MASEGAGNQPGGQNSGQNPDGSFTQNVNYNQISARIPEKISRGVCATAVLVLHGAHEVAFDFLQRLVPPHQVAARVVMPYGILHSVVAALSDNWENFRNRFGSPPAPPPPPANVQPPKITDVYAEMKIPDDAATPAYANTLMITHSNAEFCFDFITDLFPRPVVTCRVYMSALQVGSFLDTLKRTLAQVQAAFAAQQRAAQQQQAAAPPPPPPPPPPAAEGGQQNDF